ncbi:hypothetical protein BXZ70DRAFT_4214 [Cristinia sonorae]|uniref:F-box domain-containing protein n=1 Tax=Cristinia sonorae TaxID=1940300 RepID=A0A8K0UY42_9AGAR|nr:hypothetical protein BXZ70DRAFT_4214 [Cristinia sonorae]
MEHPPNLVALERYAAYAYALDLVRDVWIFLLGILSMTVYCLIAPDGILQMLSQFHDTRPESLRNSNDTKGFALHPPSVIPMQVAAPSAIPLEKVIISQTTTKRDSAHKLPWELWELIFRYVSVNPSRDKLLQSVKLAAVCKFWRTVSLSCPRLWDTLVIRTDNALNRDLIHTIITRSRARGLHVFVAHTEMHIPVPIQSFVHESIHLMDVVRILQPLLLRIKVLHVEAQGGLGAAQFMLSLTGACEVLEELSLICFQPLQTITANNGQRSAHWSWMSRIHTPRLARLTMTLSSPNLPASLASFTSIRSLTLLFPIDNITFDLNVLLSSLASMKSLTELTMDGSGGPASVLALPILPFPNNVFELPSLRTLRFHTVARELLLHFILRVRFPSMTTLDITVLPHFAVGFHLFAHLNNPRNAPLLKTLCLSHFGPGLLPSIFPHLTFCCHLKLHHAGALDDLQLEGLASPQGLTATWFAPRLRSLELSHAPLVTVHALRTLVGGRKEQSTLESSVAALEDLRVFHTARLSATDRTWFRNQVPMFYWGSGQDNA